MNGLSGAVAIAGSGGGLWSARGGNQQVPARVLAAANVTLVLNTRIASLTAAPPPDAAHPRYTPHDATGAAHPPCDAVVLAAPLEHGNNADLLSAVAPRAAWDVGRAYQRTVTTFVRGAASRATFGADPPEAVLTTAGAAAPFSSLARVRRAGDGPAGDYYKVFSRAPLDGAAVGALFERGARVVAQFDWLAYPQVSRAPCRRLRAARAHDGRANFVFVFALLPSAGVCACGGGG
jgi:prenylcysteine oxidase / farnesylcysteine lyase